MKALVCRTWKARFYSKVLVFTLLGSSLGAWAFPVQVAESPSNDLSLTLRAIRSAKRSLVINIYEFTSDKILDALRERLDKGVRVDLLMEGQPVGGLSAESSSVERKLVHAMNDSRAESHFYLMTSDTYKSKRRFRYNHAKYIIVDGQSLLVGSENYSTTGNPTPGTSGTRGWETWLHSKDLAKKFRSIFASDSNTRYDDVTELTDGGEQSYSMLPCQNGSLTYVSRTVEDEDDTDADTETEMDPVLQETPVFDARNVESVTSPETSKEGLIKFIDSSKSRLDLELMSFAPRWGSTKEPSLLLKAVEKAARRGVSIRVLLNDESVFARSRSSKHFSRPKPRPSSSSSTFRKSGNVEVVELLNDYAEEHNLDLEARIADVEAMGVVYIHNKGALSDDDKTLVSSINWNANSVERNREAAMVIESAEIHDHYQSLFEKDWKAGAGQSEN